MLNKNKKYLVTIMLFFTFMLPIISNTYFIKTNADYYEWTYGLDNIYRYDGNNSILPQYRTLQHSSGKFIYTYFRRSATNLIYIDVYINYPSGTTPNYITIEIDSHTMSESYINSTSYSIDELNSTHIIIFEAHYMWNNPIHNIYGKVYLLNLNTYVVTTITDPWYASSTTIQCPVMKLGNIFQYDNKVYCVFMQAYNDSPTTKHYLGLMDFDLATNILDVSKSELWSGAYPHNSIGFPYALQYPENSDKIYVVCSYETDLTQPQYYEIDLDDEVYTQLASHSNTDRYSVNRRIIFLGSGVIINGDYIYIYYQWVYPYVDASTRYIKYVNQKLVFNQTITAVDLIGNQDKCGVIQLLYGTETNPSWVTGYKDNASISILYYANWKSSTSSNIVDKATYTVEDWLDYGGGSLDVEFESEIDYIPNHQDEEAYIIRRFSEDFQVEEVTTTPKTAWIYYGLALLEAVYDITLTWTPNDNPLLTQKSYSFTTTTFRNYIGFRSYIDILIDGLKLKSALTAINGIHVFLLTSSSTGFKTLEIKMYSNATQELLYTEEFEIKFIESAQDIETGQTVFIGSYIQYLPFMFICLVPSLGLFLITKHIIGFLSGLTLGTFALVLSNMIPIYMIFIELIIIVIGFVMVLKDNNSGG